MAVHLRDGWHRLFRAGVGGSPAFARTWREGTSLRDEHGLPAEDALVEARLENGIPWMEERHLYFLYTTSGTEGCRGEGE